MRISLFLFIGMLVILACSTSAKNGISPSEERKRITSFILVKNLPVFIMTKDFPLGSSLQKFITDTLKAMGYKSISHEERDVMYKKYFADMFGGSNTAEARKVAEKLQNDKGYLTKQMEKSSPLEQMITIFPVDSSANLIGIARTNFPITKKKREWFIPYEDSELVTTIAARIVDSMTAR
jgi:hypothetical protein